MKPFSIYKAISASSWLLVALVILAEFFAPFKDLLKTLFWHHWVGKAILVTAAFVICGFTLSEKKKGDTLAWNAVLWSLIIILLFYVIHYFT